MKYKFVSMEEGFVPVERDSFKEAFTDMYHWVKNQKRLHLQILETAIWIERRPFLVPLYFYDARDRAIDEGILKDG